MTLLCVLVGIYIGAWMERDPKRALCGNCLKDVRTNKVLFGSMHLCR